MQPILPRWLLWMLCGLLLGFVFLIHADQARSHEWWRNKECRFQNVDPGTWTDHEERLTLDCVVAKWPVPGGVSEAWSVGMCESHMYRLANNGGNYLGLFQHSATYWPDRVSHQMPDGWKIGPWQRWTNSRSQIVTTARMVHYSGSWSAWSCA
jgi:hypothetical protein